MRRSTPSQQTEYLQHLFANRIGGHQFGKSTEVYIYEKLLQISCAAIAENPNTELIDLVIGDPDEMAYPVTVQALCDEAIKHENRVYSGNACPEFRTAAQDWMKTVFGVCGLDPETEIVHSIGTKAALSILPAAFINPGDYTIMTVPGYPIFGIHTRWYGGEVYNVPLTEENHFLPDLESIPMEILSRAKVLVLSYPNNPTGASATVEFFTHVVEFAREHHLVIVSDAAYGALVFEGGNPPLSILSIPGAKEISLELHSMSKAFNMSGYQIGFVCGSSLLVNAYRTVKDNSNNGQFLAIQKAAAATLYHPDITEKIAAKYSRRMDLFVSCLQKFGFPIHKPPATMFLYFRAPKSVKVSDGTVTHFRSAEEASQWLIKEKMIATFPWDIVGSFLRMSMTFSAHDVRDELRMINEIENRLKGCTFAF
jgi:LL-diaminopimelate aminotransferase